MATLEDTATITVSSEYNASYLKANAADDNLLTQWASASEAANAWIQFNWASPVTIYEIELWPRPADNWGHPRFTFSDSSYSDGAANCLANSDVVYVLPHPITTTSLRISVAPDSSASLNTGFKEVEIRDSYTTPPSTDLTKPDHLDVSSTYSLTFPRWKAIDGITTDGWASLGDVANAWIQWTWLQSVRIDSIQLYDRPTDRWGTPRFTFADSSTQDGGVAISNLGYTTYTMSTPVTTTSVKITVLSGGSGNNRGIAEAILTGLVNPVIVSRVYGPAAQCM